MVKDELRTLSKNDLVRLVLSLQERVEVLEKLLAGARKNSSTSSKPPSSDIVKPPKAKPRKGKKRKIGGQPGHKKHERTPFPPEEVDTESEYSLPACDTCHQPLMNAGFAPEVIQQVELVGRRFVISEHRLPWYWCPCCRTHQRAEPAPEIQSGLFGPRMSAFVAYLKGACHMSYTTVQILLRDAWGIKVSTGYLAKVVRKVGVTLGVPYTELRGALAGEPWLNVDETGHKDRGTKHWTWCFRAAGYTVFKIDRSRGSCVLEEVLGEAFGGILGSDLYSAYVKFAGDRDLITQLCLAHLIRDVRYLTTLSDKVTKNYGTRLLKAIRKLFRVIHRREKVQAHAFRRALEKAKAIILKTAKAAPQRAQARTMAERFKKHGESYFTFITTPGVAPTNNAAEQAIRHVVIDRRITQGTRGTPGQQWSERIWTTLASCAQQGRSAFDFIAHAVEASIAGSPAPSLLPP